MDQFQETLECTLDAICKKREEKRRVQMLEEIKCQERERKRARRKQMRKHGFFLIIVLLFSAAFIFNPSHVPKNNPATHSMMYDNLSNEKGNFIQVAVASEPPILKGKILTPIKGSIIQPATTVTGYTEGLPVDYPYVLICVDVDHLGLCWSKSIQRANAGFVAEIYEGGPTGDCTVSLYALNRENFKKVAEWIKSGKLGGMPMLSDEYRIHSMTYSFKGEKSSKI